MAVVDPADVEEAAGGGAGEATVEGLLGLLGVLGLPLSGSIVPPHITQPLHENFQCLQCRSFLHRLGLQTPSAGNVVVVVVFFFGGFFLPPQVLHPMQENLLLKQSLRVLQTLKTHGAPAPDSAKLEAGSVYSSFSISTSPRSESTSIRGFG
mmetsp:Transcript_65372/g.121875  ORF Transcript_65372/g.121875 Transcript_65372/m.121875 type:complete len:152 (+) Transcript_65372:87-542(+)